MSSVPSSLSRAAMWIAVLALAPALVHATPSIGDGPEVGAFVPVPAKPGAAAATFTGPMTRRPGASGALTGKTVYVSAGHGWTFVGTEWRTQRGNTHDLVEDFITAEGVNQYLIPYLHAMGAYVVPIREADLNPNLVVVDDVDATLEGEPAELADEVGWGPLPVVVTGMQNPFALGRARSMTATATETGRVVYPTEVPASGYYNVYVAYVQGADRVADAHVIVHHAGGASHVRVDQRRHGSTWVLLGRWYFEAGAGPERAAVVIANDSAEPGRVISFDAVRLGGGMAVHERGGVTTGRPAYESAARYSTQLLGAPPSVWDYSEVADGSRDVVARPRFAAWEHEAGEDAIYVAYHTNAPSPARGTMSIAFGNTFPCCSGLGDFAGTPGSLELLVAVHDELVGDLRAAWDPTWRDAGKVTAALGELRPTHNGEMPAILVEIAFHDTLADAEALRAPRFRNLAARAMAQGIAKFFAAKDQRALVLPPEPPSAVRVENLGGGALRVSWRPPAADGAGGDAPTAYRVHVSDNGYGFDDGIEVTGESHVLDGLAPGALRFVRITARNEGGASLPTEVVGARVATTGTAAILVVGGVDRLDKDQLVRDPAPFVGTIDRMWLDRMNNGTYAARHATALAAAGFSFDGATDDAVEQDDLDLAAYRAIDWFTGEDAVAEEPLSAASRAALARFFLGGGKLILSGSRVIGTLHGQGSAEAELFATGSLRVGLGPDPADTYDVVPEVGLFGALAPFTFRDDGPLGYDAELPDVLVPAAGATTVLTYATGGAAGVAWEDGDGGSRGIVLGFPLEVIVDDATRRELLAAALASFGLEPDGEPEVDLEAAGCGCDGGAGGGGLVVVVVVGAALRGRRRAPAVRPIAP